jgi:hypothetical protein
MGASGRGRMTVLRAAMSMTGRLLTLTALIATLAVLTTMLVGCAAPAAQGPVVVEEWSDFQ